MAAPFSHEPSLERKDMLRDVTHAHDAALRRGDMIRLVTDAQVGATNAFGEVVDAHNILVCQLQDISTRQDCAAGESARIVDQLRALEGQFQALYDDIRDELRDEILDARKSADEARERAAAAQRREVREDQGVLAKQLTRVDEHLATLDASFRTLGMQLQEQSSQFLKQLVEQQRQHESLQLQREADHRFILEESLPELRSDVFGRIEGVSAGFGEKTTQQTLRIGKIEKQFSGYQSMFDKAVRDRQNVMVKHGLLEARVGKAEQMCVEAGQEINKEIMQLEGQIELAKRVLCDHMKAIFDDYRKAGQDEAADVLNKVGAECRRIGILEKTVATLSEELERRLSNIIGQHHGLAEHVAKDFDIARSEIATGRAQLQMLEATAHDLKVDMQSCTQQANRDRDEFTAQLSEFGAQHRQISSCLARCEPLFNQVEDAMKSAVADREKLRENPEFAASVTHCLSCGQNRNLCPWPCSPFILDKDALTPGTDPDDTKNTAKRPESYGFRPMRSRPTSAGKFSQSCETRSTTSTSSGIVPAAAGAAHVICRVAGGPGTPRPQSSHRYRAAKSTPVVDRAL
mmetsp:Transcript_72742/g.144192  ORF Transcript_72742/g.144192 Transcript_72742/m.144192 type:complete len:575 (-) Transcript_72742:68-1792(-)